MFSHTYTQLGTQIYTTYKHTHTYSHIHTQVVRDLNLGPAEATGVMDMARQVCVCLSVCVRVCMCV